MTPDLLMKHFDRIAEAPEAIPRMRQFILELAVRGKLVDQDSRDEPVLRLLERLQRDRLRRPLNGSLSKHGSLPPVGHEEAWFVIPETWSWVRLGEVTQVVMGQSPPGDSYNKIGEGIPLINGPVEFTEGPFGKTFINQYTTAPTNMCEEGDLLLCVRGSTTGRTNVAAFRACIGRGVAAIRPLFDDRYIRLFVWRLRASIIAMGRGIAFPSVNRDQIVGLPIPLPPLGEQHRIAAKVDELMALCDQLKAAQAKREERRNTLVAAANYHLTNGGGAEELRSHATFYCSNLTRLIATRGHIDQLRNTLLRLAFRGHMVRQLRDDEPASNLLARIRTESRNDSKQNKRKVNSKEPCTEEPFQVPYGWCWASFPELGVFGRGKSKHRPRNDPSLFVGGTHAVIQTGDVARSKGLIKTYTSKYNDVGLAQSAKWPAGTLCITIAANIADTGILTFDACFPDSVVGFIPSPLFPDAKYFEYFLRTAKAELLEFAPATAQKNINLEILRSLRVPLPPLAEQVRIVTRVGELMAFCDALELQLDVVQTESGKLLDAVLHEALESDTQTSSRVLVDNLTNVI